MFALFLKGLIIGFAIAAPVGPIGILCIQPLTNPATILSFVALFAGLGLGTVNPDFASAIRLVLGITLGSAVWWLLLSGGVAFIFHRKLSHSFFRIINWISGSIMLAFGIFALISRVR